MKYLLPMSWLLSFRSCLFVAVGLLSQPTLAEKVLELQGGAITGTKEQPKVLYIVPWQEPSGPVDLYRPIESEVERLLGIIDREQLSRELEYYDAISNPQQSNPNIKASTVE